MQVQVIWDEASSPVSAELAQRHLRIQDRLASTVRLRLSGWFTFQVILIRRSLCVPSQRSI